MPKLTPEMPQDVEALLAHVRAREPLNTVEWHEELCRLRSLSVTYKLGVHATHANTIDLSDGSVGQIGLPTVTIIERCDKEYAAGDIVSGPCIVYPDAPDEQVPLDAVGKLVPLHCLPALLVNLDHSDELIRAEFDRILREARKHYRAPFLKTGPKTEQLDWPGTFRKWKDHRIVELCELLAWRRQCRHLRAFPEHVLGGWLKFDKNRIGYAKKVLNEAIASLPMLEARARHDRETMS